MPSRALDSARGLSVSGRSGLADAIVPQSIVIMEERNILYKFIRIFFRSKYLRSGEVIMWGLIRYKPKCKKNNRRVQKVEKIY